MKHIKSLIKNILNEDMDAAKADVHNIVTRLSREHLDENWDTVELGRLIMDNPELQAVMSASNGPEARDMLYDYNPEFFKANDIDLSQVHWGKVFHKIKGEAGRYNQRSKMDAHTGLQRKFDDKKDLDLDDPRTAWYRKQAETGGNVPWTPDEADPDDMHRPIPGKNYY